MSYDPPTGLLREAESLIEELEKVDTSEQPSEPPSEPPSNGGGDGGGGNGGGGNGGGGNGGGGNDESTAGASGALIAAAGLAGTAYFFMSDQE